MYTFLRAVCIEALSNTIQIILYHYFNNHKSTIWKINKR